MIVTVTVTGIIIATAQAFSSRFAVKCDNERQALDAVEADLDWSGTCISRSVVDGRLDEDALPSLAPGAACRI